MVKVAFLDRDGTLIKDSGYTFRIDDLMWVPDAIAGLSFLVSLGFADDGRVSIVTGAVIVFTAV